MSGLDALHAHLRCLDPRLLERDIDVARIGQYRGYSELVTRWLALADRGARARIIGSSVAGTPLVALRIGPDVAPRTSVIMAGIHPIEWIGVETMLALLERLAAAPPRDRRIVAFPLLNVDGYRRVEADLRAGRRRWRRSNGHGVDLNRNFPTYFRARSWLSSLALGGGPYPLSEPEIAAVSAALDREAGDVGLGTAAGRGSQRTNPRSRIDVALSLHSFGRMILTPYGGRWRPPGNAAQYRRAARAVRDALPEHYTIRQVSHWLPGVFVRGMEIDHLHDRYGAMSLLIECCGGLRLCEPGSWVHPFRWYNPPDPAARAAEIARAVEPFVRGLL